MISARFLLRALVAELGLWQSSINVSLFFHQQYLS